MSEEPSCPTSRAIPSIAQARHFRIQLRGQLEQGWMAAFDPLYITSADLITTIEVKADQAALRGILNHLWDLNLDIFSVVEVAGQANQIGEN